MKKLYFKKPLDKNNHGKKKKKNHMKNFPFKFRYVVLFTEDNLKSVKLQRRYIFSTHLSIFFYFPLKVEFTSKLQ